ncbi:hypothetical protein EDC32_102385 [Laceyella sacchari]|jgi:hypothetical protein|uniref:hypothetical protein n=1 Tax=Laceyella sacchari TaxID=37482 RepID=UPI001050CC21|nr:hypothetical protein [Laceyella sacchari]TCW39140.1 hypothetical protein EDC32_102385 [Laceyella sacchari]
MTGKFRQIDIKIVAIMVVIIWPKLWSCADDPDAKGPFGVDVGQGVSISFATTPLHKQAFNYTRFIHCKFFYFGGSTLYGAGFFISANVYHREAWVDFLRMICIIIHDNEFL